jgi:lysophospholipase L1-like esterase
MGKLARLSAATVISVLFGLAAALPAQASDENQDSLYLATGDSVPFGFNPLLSRSSATNFVGYPDVVAKALDLDLTNSSCPGEASGGFISLTGTDNVCRPYRAYFPLHVGYSTSQLDFVVNFLRSHRRTRLVTITIGANDLFVLEKSCPPITDPGFVTCVEAGLPSLLAALGANLEAIYSKIRSVYHHGLVALTYYALNYADPVGVQVIGLINAVIGAHTLAWRGKVADGFAAFQKASSHFGGSTCAAGLRIVLVPQPAPPADPCDVHPTAKGRNLLARAVLRAVDEGGDH